MPALRDAGHDVVTLVRRAPAAEHEIAWDPAAGTIDAERLAGVDAVVHLAGETIGQRWSAGARERIRGSRVDGTGLIARTMAALEPQPAASSSRPRASATTGSATSRSRRRARRVRGSPPTSSRRGRRRPSRRATAGIRVVALRQAPILDRHEGPVGRMRLPFRLGLGGRVGSGSQWWCWVSLPDVVRVYLHALGTDLAGPVNVVGGSVTNREFTKALGRALHRPTVFPLPAFAVRLAFGQMGEELLLGGQRPVAERLERAGFAFHDTDLDARDGRRARVVGLRSGILAGFPTKEVAVMTETASSRPRPARLVG